MKIREHIPGFCALIIAGGKSKRMAGIDKTRIEINGKPLILRIVQMLSNIFDDVIIASDCPGRYKDIKEAQTVVDAVENIGPVGGLLSGLKASKTEWLFVTAADMPFLNPDVIKEITSLANENCNAVVPNYEGRIQPLCAAYKKDIIPVIKDRIESGKLSVTGLCRQINALHLKMDDTYRDCFFNINTPPDLKRIKS